MEMNDRITVHMEEKPVYDIVFARDFDGIGEEITGLQFGQKKACIVTDSTVASYYLQPFQQALEKGGCFSLCTAFVFPAGEENKTLDVVRNLYEHLILNRFDRKDLLIALGGGVVGDLAGFAAATYLRGVSFLQVPTTLLAQVDSSIGGKTGVDFDSYKNMVGAFHMPRLVYMNLSTLKTLTDRQYREGMGEIVKHALIKDASYFQWLKENMDEILNRELSVCGTMIRRSCEIKRDVVEKDPKELGERALLNYGHTLGHAIEKEIGFSLLHGECVSLGSVCSAYISKQRGLLSEETYEEIRNVLKMAGLPVTCHGNITAAQVMEAVGHDKKMDAGVLKFILLEKIGNAYIDRTVAKSEMEEALSVVLGKEVGGA